MADETDEFEVKGQFLFCCLCRLNHDKGRKHIYSRKHKALLSKLLTKFGKKVTVFGSLELSLMNCLVSYDPFLESRPENFICEPANRLFRKLDLLTCFQGNKMQTYCDV